MLIFTCLCCKSSSIENLSLKKEVHANSYNPLALSKVITRKKKKTSSSLWLFRFSLVLHLMAGHHASVLLHLQVYTLIWIDDIDSLSYIYPQSQDLWSRDMVDFPSYLYVYDDWRAIVVCLITSETEQTKKQVSVSGQMNSSMLYSIPFTSYYMSFKFDRRRQNNSQNPTDISTVYLKW